MFKNIKAIRLFLSLIVVGGILFFIGIGDCVKSLGTIKDFTTMYADEFKKGDLV